MVETSFALLLLRLAGIHALAAGSPGPDVLLVLRHSLRHGRAAGLAATAGILLGVGCWIGLGLGLRATLAEVPALALQILQALGGGYLLWLGLRGLRGGPIALETAATPPSTRRAALLQGLLTNLTNAKALLYFVALFTQGLPADLSLPQQSAVATTLLGTQAAIFTAFATAAAWARRQSVLLPALHWLDRLGSLALAALGLWLLASAA